MAAGRIVLPAYQPALDSDGNPISGAKIYTYYNNTTTPRATYTDAGLSVPHANPVVADSSGVFASIFADRAVSYSVTVTDASGAPLASYDNVQASSVGSIDGPVARVLDFIPADARAEVIAGTYTDDATDWIQAAIDTGDNVDLQGLTLYASGLTMATTQRALFSSIGTAELYKNSNGAILTISAADVTVSDVIFRGESPTYTGDNVSVTGARCTFINCGSQYAAGRALKCTGDALRVVGTNGIWHTDDATATGFDIEVGVSGTATLYHELHAIYTSQATGGIKLIDTGSHVISGRSQFGKLHIDSGTGPAGSNGGITMGARILGNVTVELASAVFTGNQFGAVNITFAAGTSGCRLDETNTLQVGATITNSGNGSSNYIVQSIGTGAYPYNGVAMKYGVAADAIELTHIAGTGLLCNWDFLLKNAKSLRVRNAADTADRSVISMSQGADNVFVGHGTGTSTTYIQGGSGGTAETVSGTIVVETKATQHRPAVNNTVDLGTTALRWKDGFSATWDATTAYKVNTVQVVGARKTGWTAATGTATRTTFDTATVTLPQLAERVKALIDDLHATAGHGLIGA